MEGKLMKPLTEWSRKINLKMTHFKKSLIAFMAICLLFSIGNTSIHRVEASYGVDYNPVSTTAASIEQVSTTSPTQSTALLRNVNSTPLWAFNGANATYQIKYDDNGDSQTGGPFGPNASFAVSVKLTINHVQLSDQTFDVSGSLPGILPAFLSPFANISASFDNPSPFPSVSQSDLGQLNSGTIPTDISASEVSTGISVSVPAGTFTADKVTFGDGSIEFIDMYSGLIIQTSASLWAITSAVSGGATLVLTDTNISSSKSSPLNSSTPVVSSTKNLISEFSNWLTEFEKGIEDLLDIFHLPYQSTTPKFSNTVTSTTVTLTSTVSATVPNETMMFTAHVSPVPDGGTIQFQDNRTDLGGPVNVISGQATYSTSALSAGSHAIMAIYSGDAHYTGSKSSLNISLTNFSVPEDQWGEINETGICFAIASINLDWFYFHEIDPSLPRLLAVYKNLSDSASATIASSIFDDEYLQNLYDGATTLLDNEPKVCQDMENEITSGHPVMVELKGRAQNDWLTSAHSVVAYGFVELPDEVEFYVADSNFPGGIIPLYYDNSNQSFSYPEWSDISVGYISLSEVVGETGALVSQDLSGETATFRNGATAVLFNNGVSVNTAGSVTSDGTSVSVTGTEFGSTSPSGTGTIQLTSSLQYYDVEVSSISNLGAKGVADISIAEPSVTAESIIEHRQNDLWNNATNYPVSPPTITGDIPVSDIGTKPDRDCSPHVPSDKYCCLIRLRQ
jgi:hypothetical protein